MSLLRAINLGSRNKVAMPQLREALTAAGFDDVASYVQSGNLITRSRHRNPERVAAVVHDVLLDAFALDVPVVVRSPAALRAVLAWDPFPDAAEVRPKVLHVVHLFGTPEPADVDGLLGACAALPERVAVRGQEVVVDYGESMHASTVQGLWLRRRLGGVDGTARSWRTLTALCELTAGG